MTSMKAFQRVCAWSGVGCCIVFFLGFVLADFIPPPSPDLSATAIAQFYRENLNGVRLGAVCILLSTILYLTFSGVIAAQIRRIPGVHVSVAYVALASGALSAATTMLSGIFFLTTTFRPDRPVEDTQLMSDLSFILMLIAYAPFIPQALAFVFGILSDKGEAPLFPRWLGYLNIWCAMLYTPAVGLAFFKTGPLAWDGIFVFWIPATAFITYFVVNTVMLLKAIDRSEDDEVSDPSERSTVPAGSSGV